MEACALSECTSVLIDGFIQFLSQLKGHLLRCIRLVSRRFMSVGHRPQRRFGGMLIQWVAED